MYEQHAHHDELPNVFGSVRKSTIRTRLLPFPPANDDDDERSVVEPRNVPLPKLMLDERLERAAAAAIAERGIELLRPSLTLKRTLNISTDRVS